MRRQTALLLGSVALALATADLVTKALVATPAYAFHSRPLWQMLLGGALVATQSLIVPILGVRVIGAAAGVSIGGAAGNLASAAIWGSVPNPILVEAFGNIVALNLADVFVVAGTGLLALAVVAHGYAQRGRLRARL